MIIMQQTWDVKIDRNMLGGYPAGKMILLVGDGGGGALSLDEVGKVAKILTF